MRFLSTFNRTAQEDPLKVFRFAIEIDNFARFGFMEMSGLSAETETTEYREGTDATTPRKSPGQTKFSALDFKRGLVLAAGAGAKDIADWYNQVFNASARRPAASKLFRRTIDVVVFDREGVEAQRYRVVQAWCRAWKPIGDGLKGLGSDDIIEGMTVEHEGFRLIVRPS